MIVRKIFWFCSGIYFPLLKKSPTEKEKYFGIGGTVFFTGVFAALAAGYALFTVFQEVIWAMLFGLFWGLMILNLDRFIVSSMRKQENKWKELQMATPRFILAILLAIVISKPLELKIFEREINNKIEDQKIQMAGEAKSAISKNYPEIQWMRSQMDSLKNQIDAAEKYRNVLQEEYDLERFGTKTPGTSGLVGLGTNARKKEMQLDAAQQFLEEIRKENRLRMDDLQLKIDAVFELQNIQLERNQQSIQNYDGLAARIDALDMLQKESYAMFTASIFITLLFIAIESAPILVKLISNSGPYDFLLQAHEDEVKSYVYEKRMKSEFKSQQRLKNLKVTEEGVL
jgi:hypothetical protein